MMLLLALFAPWAANAQTTVEIGDGTSTQRTNPIGTYYNYSITEQLYTAEEIGTAGTISSISFNYAVSTAKDFPITVYMANVDAENLSSGISLADADEVFSGTLSVSSPGWATITLDAPFAYDGTSNLLIGVIKDYLYYYNDYTWYVTTTDAVMARYTQSDSAGPYTTSTVPESTSTSRPNIQIVITPSSGPVCEKPTTLTAFDITPNSAWLSWEGGSTPGAGYNVELKGGDYADWTRIYSNVSQGCILTNLTPGTSYSARVQVNCSENEASGWKSVNFTTACDAITTFPWTETFESYAAGDFNAPCWVNEHISGSGSYIFKIYTSTTSGNSTHQLQLPDMAIGTLTKLVLPEMNLPENYEFSIDIYRSSSTYNTSYAEEGIRVYASTNGEIEGATELAFIPRQYAVSNDVIPAEAAQGWYTYELPIGMSGTCYIILRGESQYCTSTYMDNFAVKEMPTCLKPTNFAKANVTAHTVDLSWTSEASAWVLAYKAANDEDFTEVNVTENPYTLTGLIPETAYTVKVKADCGNDGYSEWTGELTFTTGIACTAPTNLASSDITAHGATITWTAEEGAMYQYALVKTLEYDVNNLTWSESFEGNTQSWSDLNAETGYTFALRKDCGAEDGYSSVVTKTFTTLVACPVPTGLTAALTPGNGSVATLSWTSDASEWVVAYKTAAEENFTEVPVTVNPYTLTGLTPETTYNVKVKAVCGGDDGESQYSSAITFTPTDAYVLTVNDGTNTNGYVPVYGMWVDNYSKSQFIIPATDLAAMQWGTINKLTFYAQNASVDWGVAEFEVYMTEVSYTTFDAATLVDWANMDKVMNAASLGISGNVMEVALDAPYQYMGGNLLIGIRQVEKGTYVSSTWYGVNQEGNTTIGGYESTRSLGLYTFLPKTSFAYEPGEEPECIKPTGVTASDVTAHEATISWTSDATAWQIQLNEEEAIDVTEATYTFTGLTPETTYSVKVRANCSGIYSDWTNAMSFTTTIACPAPTELAATLIPGDGSMVTLSWTSYASEWVVAYKPATDTVFTEVPVTENPYTLTGLTPETTYEAKVKAVCGGDDGESEWSTAISFEPSAKIVIGSGTATSSYVPVTTCYNYSLSQQIYTAAELGEAGAILSIDFYSTNGATKARNFDIYMVSTDKSSFESTTDWIAVTANDLVYSATNYTWQTGWNTFELDNPFIYDGTSNVAIIVDDEMVVSYECSVNFRVFNATSQAIYVRQDGANYDPFNTSAYTATGVLNVKNQIRVLIGEPPACPKPTGLAVNYEGGTSATFTWTENGTATSWDLQYDTDPDFTNPVFATVNDTPTYELTGLSLATTYYVRVNAFCDAPSDYSNTVSFTTDFCMPENMCELTFTLTDSYGDSWNGNAIQVKDVVTGVIIATIANQDLDGTTGEETQTVALNVCDGRQLEFSWISGSYIGEVSYTVTDINGEIIVEGSGSGFETFNYTVSCAITTCRRPTNLAVTEVGPHSAMLSWTENGEATEWVVEITDVLGGQITVWNASANPYTIVGLEPETDYSVRVRPICSDFDDKWSTAITFTTDIACPKPYDLTITPYPFTANVEWSGFGESYTIEWVEAPATRDGLWLQYDNGTHYTSIGSSTEGYRYWGVRYPAEMLEGNNTLTKVAVMESSYYVDTIPYTINIYSGDTPETGTLVGTETVNPTGTQGMREITLSTPATINPFQSLWITLTAYGTYMMPACTVNNPDNQWWDNNADGIWTIMGEDNTNLANYGWMIRGYVEGYDPTAFDWNVETGVTSPYTIEGLNAETTYLLRLKADCGGDGESEYVWSLFTTPSACDAPVELEATDITYNAATLNWVGYQDSYNVQYREATKYVTVWEDGFENGISDEWTIVAGEGATHPDAGIWYTINPIDGLSFEAHGGDYCASSWSWNNSEYQADNWLITPQLDLQGVLKYYVRTNASYPDSYEVLLSTTDAETTSFTVTLKEMAAAPGNGEWNEVIIDLSAYNGQTGYIAIHHVDYDMNYLCIDDFGIYSVVEATAWIPATTTEPTLALTGLTHDTDYEWQVQGINAGCDGGLTEWSEIASFTAAPLPTQTIALNEGWNWVSFDVEITLNDLKAVLLEAVPGTAITIRSKTQTHSYNPSNGRWSGRLTWDLSQMYRISVTTDCEVAVQGFPVDPAEHPANVLGNGQFNWIAFPLSESMSLTNAFAGFAVNGDLIRSKNGNSQYNRGRWQGSTLTTLQPGQGYIYKSSTSAATRTLTFPGGNRQTVAPETVQPQPKLSVNPTMVKMPRTIDLFPTKK